MTKWNGEENFFKQKLWRIYARIDSEFKLKGWNNSYYLIPSIISHIYYKLDYYIQNHPIFNLPHWLTTILKIIKLFTKKKEWEATVWTPSVQRLCVGERGGRWKGVLPSFLFHLPPTEADPKCGTRDETCPRDPSLLLLETVSADSILLLHAHRAKTRESESVGFLREICYGSISVTGW